MNNIMTRNHECLYFCLETKRRPKRLNLHFNEIVFQYNDLFSTRTNHQTRN